MALLQANFDTRRVHLPDGLELEHLLKLSVIFVELSPNVLQQ